MLSYQHIYHAGCHADVLKHVVLGEIVAAMQQKEKPLFMLDAFASRGLYHLDSDEALKNREFETGIGRLWPLRDAAMPAGVRRWLDAVRARARMDEFTPFPGSTALLQGWQRPQDRLAACDLHPQEFDALRGNFNSDRSLALHKRDAYEAIRGLLPPKEKRGLVFLDPSYEEKDEYVRIARAVADAYPHFRTGVFAIWYPLLPAARHEDLYRALRRSGLRKILRVELDGRGCFASKDQPMQMQGSGILIINPPWHAQEGIRSSLAWIKDKLTGQQGTGSVNWLVPE
ncbi:MAG: 23S rRNA (adenine(2030)-N(6))-methyltransferase RlmJ [Mariprofundaceae bacterium]|nr:23S rRNA (adenine(2030)-N(6))-methyltransferase RlmJ [Mariprofundaceae bacterium]